MSEVRSGVSSVEFMAGMTSNVLSQQGRVMAVMVIVAYAPREGEKSAPIAMQTWGAPNLDQAAVLRELAVGIAAAPDNQPAVASPAH